LRYLACTKVDPVGKRLLKNPYIADLFFLGAGNARFSFEKRRFF
jgi:hypothetical protein